VNFVTYQEQRIVVHTSSYREVKNIDIKNHMNVARRKISVIPNK